MRQIIMPPTLVYVIALKIDFLPFAMILSKGERPVHGSTSSPRTGSSFVIEIIFSSFVVSIAISMADSCSGGNDTLN